METEGIPAGRKPNRVMLGLQLGCLLAVCAVLVSIFIPIFQAARPASSIAHCLHNLKQLTIGEIAYAADNDDRLPPPTTWMDAITPFVEEPEVFRCPKVPEGAGYGYAMNCTLPHQSTAAFPDPAKAVLLFESVFTQRNAATGVNGFPDPPRHNRMNTISYVDGHVKVLPAGSKP